MAAGGGFTKWSGLGLNLAISLVSGLVLYFLGKELAGSRACGCLACLLGSLNFMALNMSLHPLLLSDLRGFSMADDHSGVCPEEGFPGASGL